MSSYSANIKIARLGKSKFAALQEQAKSLGMSADRYAKHLIEEGIRLEEKACSTSFDELFEPVQRQFRKSAMSEADLDKLVDAARTDNMGNPYSL